MPDNWTAKYALDQIVVPDLENKQQSRGLPTEEGHSFPENGTRLYLADTRPQDEPREDTLKQMLILEEQKRQTLYVAVGNGVIARQ